jgi:hypothetical protein
MKWLPKSGMWLTYLQVRAQASQLRYDLAVDPSGRGRPSPVDAGLASAHTAVTASQDPPWPLWVGLGFLAMVLAVFARARRSGRLAV